MNDEFWKTILSQYKYVSENMCNKYIPCILSFFYFTIDILFQLTKIFSYGEGRGMFIFFQKTMTTTSLSVSLLDQLKAKFDLLMTIYLLFIFYLFRS